jgi:hypothetical protein
MSETHRARQILRRIDAVLAGLLATIVALNIVLYVAMDMALNRTDMEAKQRSVTRSLEGPHHAAVVIAPKGLADAVGQFFLDRK